MKDLPTILQENKYLKNVSELTIAAIGIFCGLLLAGAIAYLTYLTLKILSVLGSV